MGSVLVIDDELVICKSVQKILAREGHAVEYVLNAREALDRLENTSYDVVITDLKMPSLSGMELLKMTKDTWPDIPVIMITGYATVPTAVQALKMGAFDYIPKPFTPDEMRSVTARALERRRLTVEQSSPEKLPEKDLPRITIPEDFYIMSEQSWAKVENGQALIGLDSMFVKTVGEIINIELPFEGDELEQGKACARVINFNRKIFNVWSPLGGQVVDVNNELNKCCSSLNQDPYGRGWMILLKPRSLEEEVENLYHHTGDER